MIGGAERFRCLGILYDRADFLAKQVGEQGVGIGIVALVGPQLGQHADEIAGGP